MPEPLLAVAALDAFYGDIQALFGVALEVGRGEAVAVIGANGAGKSTLLKSIAGLLPARPQAIAFDGAPIGGLAAHRGRRARHRAGAGRPAAVPVAERRGKSSDRRPAQAARAVDAASASSSCFRCSRSAARSPAPLCPAASSRWWRIGRALMSNPRLLLCDEISLGLAPIVVRDIYARLPAIVGQGTAVVIVEQDIVQALKAAHRVYCLQEGRVALCRRGGRADARTDRGGLFRSVGMDWVNVIVQGVLVGGLYALFAAGLSLIFGVMRLVNIAHGDLIVLAAYVALVVDADARHRAAASLVVVVPVMAVLGYVLQRFVLNRTLGDDLLPPLLVTFGLSVIIQNGLLTLFTADSVKLQAGALEVASIRLARRRLCRRACRCCNSPSPSP